MHINSIVNTDPTFQRKDHYNAFDRFALKYIKDERDLPFVYLTIRILLMTLPVAILLYIPGMFHWWIAVPYIVVNLLLNNGPFVLMLHNTSHRKLFKKEYEWMNNFLPWIVGPFCGESPETYYAHHVGMHHPENNLPEDLSCTMQYQRDSIIDYLRYFSHFMILGFPELIMYHKRKRRYDFMRWVISGEISFYVLVVVLMLINWKATLVIFVLPFLIVRFSMMAGNWGQHAFIDANDPANCYRNSITCINSGYNKTCFNDGYHIGHHLRPAQHWTDMPGDFMKHRSEYIKNKAIIFEGVDFFFVWFLLMIHNYPYLAKKFVHLDDSYKTNEEVIAFLKERTRRIPQAQIMKFRAADLTGRQRMQLVNPKV